MNWLDTIHVGDCRKLMRAMVADGLRVNCIITSPPYWGLRDYGVRGQFGLERTWQRHVARMRGVFRIARELLADDGTLWLNYGDSYAGRGGQSPQTGDLFKGRRRQRENVCLSLRGRGDGLKEKDLIGMPWRVAFALQDDGWYLRSDVVWHKPNPMPESTKDRPTKAHEYVFLLARSGAPVIWQARDTLEWSYTPNLDEELTIEDDDGQPLEVPRWRGQTYYYDAQAISEPVTGNAHTRGKGINPKAVSGWGQGAGVSHDTLVHAAGKSSGTAKFSAKELEGNVHGATVRRADGFNERWARKKQNESFSAAVTDLVETRNVRTVWTIGTEAFGASHFATFPRELVSRCILAGTRPGDIVFDPFMGSGTVAECALSLGRRFVGCELNPEYAAMFESHRSQQQGFQL